MTEVSKKPSAKMLVLDTARQYWPAIIALPLFVAVFWSLLDMCWGEWMRSNGYYSHGIIVPFISAYLVWANRKRLASVLFKPSWLGILLIVPSIPIYMFGRWTAAASLTTIAFFAVLVGAVLLLMGVRATRILLFPLLYLFFMIPLPSPVLDEATMRIQLQSTKVATAMLSVSGYDVQQVGSKITSSDIPGGALLVGVECSGFKLLISLLTFTAFFVYILSAPAWKKALIVLFSLPLSLFINSLRITMIGYAGIWTGSSDIMHQFHDYSGYAALIICFFILFGFARIIKAGNFWVAGDTVSSPLSPVEQKRHVFFAPKVALLILLALMLLLNLGLRPLREAVKGHIVLSAIPKSFGAWESSDVPIDKRVRDELGSGDSLQRLYTNSENGGMVSLFMTAGKDNTAFHNPLMCIQGGGGAVSVSRGVVLDIRRPRPVKVEVSVLEVADPVGPDTLIIYWYMRGTHIFPTTSALREDIREEIARDLWNSIVHFLGNRRSVTDQVQKQQYVWYRFSTEVVNDVNTDLDNLKRFVIEFISHQPNFGE